MSPPSPSSTGAARVELEVNGTVADVRASLSTTLLAVLRDDLHLYYDPAPLAKIEAGVAQAIARHILTHRDQPTGGWLIDNLIKAVGADGDSVTMRHRRREIRACTESLKTVGLLVDNDRIFREAA